MADGYSAMGADGRNIQREERGLSTGTKALVAFAAAATLGAAILITFFVTKSSYDTAPAYDRTVAYVPPAAFEAKMEVCPTHHHV